MAAWSVVFLLTITGSGVFADPEGFTFPELARGGSRIVSGWEAEEGQIPYQLSLRMVNPVGTVNACGGTIIHPEWGLTAAHCTAGRVTMVVRAGAVNLTRPEVLFETTEYYNHPLYNENLPSVVQPNDVGLLRFGRALTFSDRVSSVRLARSVDMDQNYAGVRLQASGWGLTWTQGSAPENLNWVFLTGVSNMACFLAFGGSSIIQDSTICASGYNVTSQSVCQGDSGGPLVVIDRDDVLSQVGIASFVSGTGCHTDVPAGFVRPAHYHSWYEQVTGISFDWDFETETTAPPEEPTTATTEETEPTEEPTTATTEETEPTEEPTTATTEETEPTEEPTTATTEETEPPTEETEPPTEETEPPTEETEPPTEETEPPTEETEPPTEETEPPTEETEPPTEETEPPTEETEPPTEETEPPTEETEPPTEETEQPTDETEPPTEETEPPTEETEPPTEETTTEAPTEETTTDTSTEETTTDTEEEAEPSTEEVENSTEEVDNSTEEVDNSTEENANSTEENANSTEENANSTEENANSTEEEDENFISGFLYRFWRTG